MREECGRLYPAVTMSAVKLINPNAEVTRKVDALAINVQAARGLQSVLRTNLGKCVWALLLLPSPAPHAVQRAAARAW